jgi:hypothetical protein
MEEIALGAIVTLLLLSVLRRDQLSLFGWPQLFPWLGPALILMDRTGS